MRANWGTMITRRRTLARTAARKVPAYTPRTGMVGMLPVPSIGVLVDALIRWLDNTTTPVTEGQNRPATEVA